ncbi:hypothetical protein F442_07695 [Phytophthora nicotianae P10297]|uniref:Uncharacterized protein n=1 Tax=Phytophthora nicotianae P10297 TaxID=1317064 RepID=W2ZFZ7_PHYNI|nr:hypothetical protein F442_07695 [Phytophthora nicotianae P10297]
MPQPRRYAQKAHSGRQTVPPTLSERNQPTGNSRAERGGVAVPPERGVSWPIISGHGSAAHTILPPIWLRVLYERATPSCDCQSSFRDLDFVSHPLSQRRASARQSLRGRTRPAQSVVHGKDSWSPCGLMSTATPRRVFPWRFNIWCFAERAGEPYSSCHACPKAAVHA